MKPRTAAFLAIPPLLVVLVWLRSERLSDLIMRRAPVVISGEQVDVSRGIVSTRGCLIFRRIVVTPGHATRPIWDWVVTSSSQLPEMRTAANRLGFGQSDGTLTATGVKMMVADSWFPYWLAEIIAMIPLLVAIPNIRFQRPAEPNS